MLKWWYIIRGDKWWRPLLGGWGLRKNEMLSDLRGWHDVHPSSLFYWRGGGWASDQIKVGGDRISIFRGELLGKRVDFSGMGGGCIFYIKNELKSEIFNNKKSLYTVMLFSVITKNLNWEISTTNLVTLVNRWDEVKDENFNMGIHWKIRLLGGFTKNQYIRGGGGNCLKRGGGLDSL